jgi:hypothetical protein
MFPLGQPRDIRGTGNRPLFTFETMTGRTYEVFADGKPVGLVGSTVRTLEQRGKAGYIKRFGSTVELRLIREIPRPEEYSDSDYNFRLKAAEAFDIARKKTYAEDGGLNKISPLIQALGHPVLESAMGKIGGPISVRNQLREAKVRGGRIGGRKRFELYGSPATSNGRRLGAINIPREAKVLGGYNGGPTGRCTRWNINRGKQCVCGKH